MSIFSKQKEAHYLRVISLLKANPVDQAWLSRAEFDKIVKDRNFSKLGEVKDENNDNFEIWGNSIFEIIVVNDGNNFKIL